MRKLTSIITLLLITVGAYAQNSSKIPFQGNLTEDGMPVNGTRKFVFSIDDVSWSETYEEVTITNGFYAVVLGSLTPLPDELFDGVDSRELSIAVDDTELGSLDLYAPFTTKALSADSVVAQSFTATSSIRVGDRMVYNIAEGDLKLYNDEGIEKLDLNVFEDNDAGSLVLYGNDDQRVVILGSSGARDGNTGFLGLYDSIGMGKVYLRVDEFDGTTTGGVLSLYSSVLNSQDKYAETIKMGSWDGSGYLSIRDVERVEKISLQGESGNAEFAGDVTIDGNLTVAGSSMISLPDSVGKLVEVDSGVFNGFTSTISGTAATSARGLYGNASTEGYNVGVQGVASSAGTNSARNTGVYGSATGEGTGDHRGVLGYANAAGKYNKGLYGIAEGAGNGDTGKGFGEGSINFGVEGNAGGNEFNNTGVEGSNFGTAGLWNFGLHGISSAGSTDSTENHGVAGRAFGPGINYGVYGQANDGVENWAGFFEGDLKVTGDLMVDGSSMISIPDSIGKMTEIDSGTIVGFTATIEGDGGDVNQGIYGFANTNKNNVGVQGTSASGSTNTERNTGVYGYSSGEGSGDHRGVVGYSNSEAKYNKGTYGIAEGAGNGDTGKDFGAGSINFGLHGVAGGNAWNNSGVEGSNYGTSGLWNFGVHGISDAGETDTTENHGVAGRAFGPGINYGIYGQAADGVTNWAGFFDGDVQTNGTLNVDGNIVATGDISGATITPSDRRLKRDITTLEEALTITRNLSGVRYTWKENAPGDRPGNSDVGVIAQEVEAQLPELVKETPDGYKAVNYSQLVAVLIEAIKELDDKVNMLKSENLQLKAELAEVNAESIQDLRKQIREIKALLNLSVPTGQNNGNSK